MKGRRPLRDETRSTRNAPAAATTTSRRSLIKAGGALAAAGVGSLAVGASAQPPPFQIRTFGKYYPIADFTPEFDLAGKFAVVTGASRGIGRATAEALVARGVTVVGTSRDAAGAPDPPTDFDLVDLDITDSTSMVKGMSTSRSMLYSPAQ